MSYTPPPGDQIAFQDSGAAYSAPAGNAIAFTTAGLAAPSGLSAAVQQDNTILVSWESIVGADGYELEIATDSSPTEIADVGLDLSYTDESGQPGEQIFYRVRSYQTGTPNVFSPWSEQISISLPALFRSDVPLYLFEIQLSGLAPEPSEPLPALPIVIELQFSYPAGIANGDLLVLAFFHRGEATELPDGYELIAVHEATADGVGPQSLVLATKSAAGNESGKTDRVRQIGSVDPAVTARMGAAVVVLRAAAGIRLSQFESNDGASMPSVANDRSGAMAIALAHIISGFNAEDPWTWSIGAAWTIRSGATLSIADAGGQNRLAVASESVDGVATTAAILDNNQGTSNGNIVAIFEPVNAAQSVTFVSTSQARYNQTDLNL